MGLDSAPSRQEGERWDDAGVEQDNKGEKAGKALALG